LHQGYANDLSADFLNFGASNFPFKIPFKKYFKIVFFLLWYRDPSGFGAVISAIIIYKKNLCVKPFFCKNLLYIKGFVYKNFSVCKKFFV
jgi:hypothetical protein